MEETEKNAKLVLIPTTLGENDPYQVLPADIKQTLNQIDYYIVENIRSARRFMKRVDPSINIDRMTFFELNKHTRPEEIGDFLEPLQNGNSIGIISEAGCPGVADPGADVVKIAHRKGYHIKPLVGPSSLLLALMASGFNGQHFAFEGYLPVKPADRVKKIRQLETKVNIENQTQLFIETPYRNNQLMSDLCKTLDERTLLCIACDITLEQEFIKTLPIGMWKKNLPDLDKRPALFLIGK